MRSNTLQQNSPFLSETEYRQLTDCLSQLVWKTDATGKQTFASSRWAEYSGIDPVGMDSFEKIVHPDDLNNITDEWAKSLSTGKTFKYEARLKSKTGEYRWFYVHGEPVLDANEKIEKWIGAFTDIHEQRSAEDELKRLKYMADHAREKFMLLRKNGSFSYVNKLAFEHWGYTEQEIQNLHVSDVLDLDDLTFENLFTVAQTEIIPPFETVHKRKDGTNYSVEVSLSGLTIENLPYLFVVARDVTERKNSLKKIRDNEERLQIVLDASDLGTWELDLLSKQVSYSEQYLKVLGYPSKIDLTHEQLIRHLHPDDVGIRQKAFKDAFETGTLNYRSRIIWNDGSLHWVEGKGKVFYDEKNKPVKMLGTIRDITDEKMYQHRIEESEQRFRTIADTAPVLIWMSGTNQLRNFFNKAWLNFTGRTAEQQIGNGWANDVHPDDLNLRQSTYLEAFEKHEPFNMEYRLKRHDGQYRWISDHGTPRYSADGVFEGFIGACMDIHERTLVEDILRTNELRFRLLADSMPQLIWTATPQGHLNYVNKSVFNYADIGFDKLNSDGWLSIVHPDDLEENLKQWAHSIKTGQSFLFEHRFRRFDGEYRWQLSRALPQKDEKGEIQMWVGSSTDIHDRKLFTDELELEVMNRTRELNKLNQDLLKSNNELAQFAYVASHDLQEPLRKIKTFASQILDYENQNLSDKGKDYFRRMQVAANRMQQLIIDLLSYSRTSLNEKPFKVTDLNTVLRNVREQLRETTESKKASIQSDPLPTLSVIPFQFEQLLTNLLSNALKFSKASVPPVIKVTYDVVSGNEIRNVDGDGNTKYHHLAVSDNGIGFDPQQEDRIFQVFQRLHGKDEFPGTGIGLAICKRIVENHQGIINALGEPEKGATFNIYLPAN